MLSYAALPQFTIQSQQKPYKKKSRDTPTSLCPWELPPAQPEKLQKWGEGWSWAEPRDCPWKHLVKKVWYFWKPEQIQIAECWCVWDQEPRSERIRRKDWWLPPALLQQAASRTLCHQLCPVLLTVSPAHSRVQQCGTWLLRDLPKGVNIPHCLWSLCKAEHF